MFRRLLIGTAIAGVLALGMPTGALAQTSEAKHDMKKAGKAIKQAGKETGEAAKETAHATKHTAKAVAHRARRSHVSARCNDGKMHSGTTRTSACAGHGGLRG